jgi:hypothetical protein
LILRLGIIMLAVFPSLFGCSQLKQSREISDGEKIFRSKCRSCHILPKKNSKTMAEWPEFLNDHAERSDLSRQEIEILTEYMLDRNTRP